MIRRRKRTVDERMESSQRAVDEMPPMAAAHTHAAVLVRDPFLRKYLMWWTFGFSIVFLILVLGVAYLNDHNSCLRQRQPRVIQQLVLMDSEKQARQAVKGWVAQARIAARKGDEADAVEYRKRAGQARETVIRRHALASRVSVPDCSGFPPAIN